MSGARCLGARCHPPAPEIAGDRGIVVGGMAEGLARQLIAYLLRHHPVVGLHLRDEAGVIPGLCHHGHRQVILGAGAQHGGTADIDVLDGLGEPATGLRDARFEGVEVDDHEVDGRDPVRRHDRLIETTPSQDAAVDLGVQGLHPPAQDLRGTGVVGDLEDGQPVVPEQPRRPAGRQDLDVAPRQISRERDEPGLVRYAQERALDGRHGVSKR